MAQSELPKIDDGLAYPGSGRAVAPVLQTGTGFQTVVAVVPATKTETCEGRHGDGDVPDDGYVDAANDDVGANVGGPGGLARPSEVL